MSAAGLSDAQIEEFREAFHLFDRNQDGTITSSNLANVLKVGIVHLLNNHPGSKSALKCY